MERLKNMSLKQAFFLLTFICLVVSLFLVMATWAVCETIRNTIPSGGVSIDFSGTITALEQPSPEQKRMLNVLQAIEILSCILLPVVGLSIAGIIFYHWKLMHPIAILREGTERIRQHDLDFSIPEMPGDELGQICAAFEAMRAELLKTNQELWRQTEEQKRLNAAFSHDLRNPITVLKGTVKLLRQGIQDEKTVKRLEIYTARIERYVDAMSSIQHLKQMPVHPEVVSVSTLGLELEETAQLLAPVRSDIVCPDNRRVSLDHGLFLTVAENLIGNAARFACQKIQITLSLSENYLSLIVADDGSGYPVKLVKDGPKPFSKLDDNSEHFGMGLYSSLILCKKHGGDLKLYNNPGAVATAMFQLF